MNPDRESRMRQLEDAVEAFVGKDDTVRVDAFLAANEPLRDLLQPMLVPPAGDPEVRPARVGDLELVREIGRGGMGVVYEADDPRLKRRVAVKLMRRSAATPASAIVRFWREAELAAALRHPGVVPVHSVGETDEAFYLVMELEPAASLAGVLAELGSGDPAALPPQALAVAARAAAARSFPSAAAGAPLPAPRSYVHAAVDVVAQVADALAHAHAQGVIHRDVKPGNILLAADGRARLTDFGLACVVDAPGVTQTGDAPGTPHYMAPEQACGDRASVGPATDVFALGVTLYEMLTLRRAFAGATTPAILLDVLHRDPTDPRRANPGLPRDLVAIVQRALEKSPSRRYPTARELCTDLRAFLRGEPVTARPISGVQRLRRWAVREPWRALVAGLLLVGLPAVGWLVTASLRREPQVAAGERVLREEWIDARLADGFREAGEGDHAAARAIFAAILAESAGREEGIAGLSVVARLESDRAALRELEAHGPALARSPALRRRQAALLRHLGRQAEADAVGQGLDAQALAFDAFLAGFGHVELGHRGTAGAHATAAGLLHRAVVTSDRARRVFYYEWLHAAAHAGDRDAEDGAIAAIQRLWPDEAASWFWIAFAQDERKDVDGAIASLQRAVAREPGFSTALCNLAYLTRRVGRGAEALPALRAGVAAEPRSVRLLRELARTLHQSRELDEAAVAYGKALELAPADPSLRCEHAGVLVDRGQLREGADIGEALVAARPDDVDARFLLATARIRLGDHRAALPHLLHCEATKPSSRARYLLGVVYNELGDVAAAQDAYEQALELEPGNATACANLAVIHLRRGEAAMAEPLLRRALAVQPTLVAARRCLLRALSDTPSAAVAVCRDWLVHAPDLAEAWRHLAWYLLQAGPQPGAADPGVEALAAARKANGMTGDKDPPTLHVLGAALLAHGDAEQACATVQRALAALPPDDKFTPYYQQEMQATLQQCEAALAKKER